MAYSSFNEGASIGDAGAAGLRASFINLEQQLADIHNVDVAGTPLTLAQNKVWCTGNGTDSEASFRTLVAADLPPNNFVDTVLEGVTSVEGFKSAANFQTVDYTILNSDNIVILASATAANRTFTLPTVVGNNGLVLTIVNSSTYRLDVDGSGAETVDGIALYALAPRARLKIIANESGTDWVILEVYNPARIKVTGASGHGSTNNKIRRLVTILEDNSNNVITYTSSSTLGDSFTVNQKGLYNIVYSDGTSANNEFHGISRNSTALTTAIQAIANEDRIAQSLSLNGNPAANFYSLPTVFTGRLEVGDVIRPHTTGSVNRTSDADVNFTITRVG